MEADWGKTRQANSTAAEAQMGSSCPLLTMGVIGLVMPTDAELEAGRQIADLKDRGFTARS